LNVPMPHCFSWNPRRVVLSAYMIFALIVGTANATAHRTVAREVRACRMEQTATQVTIQNGFIKIVVDLAMHSIVELAADHRGGGEYRSNLLAKDGIQFDHAEELPAPSKRRMWHVAIAANRPDKIEVDFRSEVADDIPRLRLLLERDRQGVSLQAAVPSVSKTAANSEVGFHLRQFLAMAFFERGAMQEISGQKRSFISRDPLLLFYALGREQGCVTVVPRARIVESALLSGGDTDFATGLELRSNTSIGDSESSGPALPGGETTNTDQPAISFELYANDLPFPNHRMDQFIVSEDRVHENDTAAYLEAVYASAAGVLGSYDEPGSAFPTLATPDRPYGDAFNFFDPDSWSVVNTLSYSGDPVLQQEARRILERSEAGILPDGQIPHHFEHHKPVYVSIAQSRQTGPNIFWLLAAMDFAAATGDDAWLRSHYAHMQSAAEWILNKFDSNESLLVAEGPLFIDVFRRSGYTLDTNVAAVWTLRRMADTAEACNDTASAHRYSEFAQKIESGVRRSLWDGHDHFFTQRNADGTTRDFVDYDGNFAAIAFGVLTDRTKEEKLLHRLDSGTHTHPGGRGTWVSEKRYEKVDCYGENDGDSDVAMARIWWLDMLARVRTRDQLTFNRLLTNVEDSLLENVWLPERYDAGGQPAHNNYYHEYPEILDMVLREMRYGVQIGSKTVRIQPFGVHKFRFRMGALHVDYSQTQFTVSAPGQGERRFEVGGLTPHATFVLSSGKTVVTDSEGTLKFESSAGIRISANQITKQRGSHEELQ
jgi:hypothetical protein